MLASRIRLNEENCTENFNIHVTDLDLHCQSTQKTHNTEKEYKLKIFLKYFCDFVSVADARPFDTISMHNRQLLVASKNEHSSFSAAMLVLSDQKTDLT